MKGLQKRLGSGVFILVVVSLFFPISAEEAIASVSIAELGGDGGVGGGVGWFWNLSPVEQLKLGIQVNDTIMLPIP